MASFQKSKTGNSVAAQIAIKGAPRESKSFRTVREAKAWAAARETEIRADLLKPKSELFTLSQVLLRYATEVSPTKRGVRWEVVRINKMIREGEEFGLPVHLPIARCTSEAIGIWRDNRLKKVSANSVRREFSILSAVLETARREWKYVLVNPVKDVRKPQSPDHRDIVIPRKQIKAMLKGFGYSPIQPIRTLSQACAIAFLLALRTGMRAGEITNLEWLRVKEGYCILNKTKTVPRNVPLDIKATRLIVKARGFDDVLVCGVTSSTLDSRFRTIRDRVGLSGFTFHDSRHTAATWLAPKLSILDLCKMFGWADPKQAMTYYNPKVTDITNRLNARNN